MKPLAQSCEVRDTVFDSTRRDTVLNLIHLVDGKIEPQGFFEETHVTLGMRTLLIEALNRLAGKSSQSLFKLTQAMGGGKTHSLITLGLLAQHPQYRAQILEGLPTAKELPPVQVVAFSGRESDVQNGIWGEIARQLGKEKVFQDYYGPLKAPGQSAWVNLLKGSPTLILLDELPPYLDNARSITVGASDLSRVTVTALTNLFNAVAEDALPNVCIVMTDLVGTYSEASVQISGLLRQLQDEAQRHSMDLTPVQLNSDEFYEILRKRLFKKLPGAAEIKLVAQGYAQAVRDAKQMDITAQSPEKFGDTVEKSYPFHPAIRDLYARFKENQGFQQTRALIRLMRIVTARMWNTGIADKAYLIGVHHLDLNDAETLSEVRQINSKLETAIPHDIADQGNSAAENLDQARGGTDAQDIAKLLFVSSLANVPNAVVGLSLPEVIAYLCEPGRDLTRIKSEVLETLSTKVWYLHSTRDGKLYFRDIQNLAAKVETLTQQFLRDQAIGELRTRLNQLFAPKAKTCYQDVLPLPTPDELGTAMDSVRLVISEPYSGKGLNPELQQFWDQTTFKNRVAFLTGNRDNFEALVETARRLKAIQYVLNELKDQGATDSDPQFKEADSLQDRFLHQFLSALKETFSVLHFPNKVNNVETLQTADFLMKFEGNKYDGEQQIIQVLKEKQKFTDEVANDTFRKKVEQRLFTTDPMMWTQIKERAATNAQWQWHRKDALEALRHDLLHKEIWAEEGSGWVRKSPLAKKTGIQIKELSRNDDTGEVHLKVTPLNGDLVYSEVGGEPTEASKKLENGEIHTREMKMSFLAVDSTKVHPKGDVAEWQNRVTLKNRIFLNAQGKRALELSAAPGGDGKTEIRFTSDGSDPLKGGAVYHSAFEIPVGAKVVLAVATRDGISSEVETISIPAGEATKVLDPGRPVTWSKVQECKLTIETYAFLDRLAATKGKASGVRIEVTGKQWVDLSLEGSVQLQEAKLRETVEVLRSLIDSGQVAIRVEKIQFDSGQSLLDWAAQEKLELGSGEWKQ